MADSLLARPLQVAAGVMPGRAAASGRRPAPDAALVIEDSPLNQAMLQSLLRHCGVACVLARDSAEAVRLHAQHAFDMVIMDLDMPMGDGLAVAESIRRHERERGVPTPMRLIAYSANADLLAANGALRRAGFTGQLRKPCNLAALRLCLDGGEDLVPDAPA